MQGSEDSTSGYVTPEIKGEFEFETTQGPSISLQTSYLQQRCKESSHNLQDQSDACSEMHACLSCNSSGDIPGEISLVPNLTGCDPSSCFRKSKNKSINLLAGIKQSSKWGHIHVRTPFCVLSDHSVVSAFGAFVFILCFALLHVTKIFLVLIKYLYFH